MGPQGRESIGSENQDWRLLICVNRRLTPASVSCAGRGSERLLRQVETLLAQRQIPVRIEPVYCFGRCGKGPNMRLAPGGQFFDLLQETDLPAIVDQVAEAVKAAPRPGVALGGTE